MQIYRTEIIGEQKEGIIHLATERPRQYLFDVRRNRRRVLRRCQCLSGRLRSDVVDRARRTLSADSCYSFGYDWSTDLEEHRMDLLSKSSVEQMLTESIGFFGGIDTEDLLAPSEVVHVTTDIVIASIENLAFSRFGLEEQFSRILHDVIPSKELLGRVDSTSTNRACLPCFESIFTVSIDECIEGGCWFVLRYS